MKIRPLAFVIGGIVATGLYFYLTSGSYYSMGSRVGLQSSSRSKSSKQASYSRNSSCMKCQSANSKRDDSVSANNNAAKSQPAKSQMAKAQAPTEPRRVNPYFIPKRIDMGHIEGKGIGYEKGYSKLSVLLAPEYAVGDSLTLIDLRGVVFDDGKLAGNVGFIVRSLPSDLCEVFGFNVSYDFREGKYGNYHQLSTGFDILHRRWEMHGNARVPIAGNIGGKHRKKCVFDNFIGPFVEICTIPEHAKQAYDLEVGYYMIKGKEFQLYAAVDPYFLRSHGSAWGGRAFVRPQFGDYFSVELSVSYDHIFRTIYQANAVFTIPLYKYASGIKHKKGPCGVENRQIYQPIDRDIVLQDGSIDCHNNWSN